MQRKTKEKGRKQKTGKVEDRGTRKQEKKG